MDAVNAKVRECIHPLLQNDLSIKINSLDETPALLGAGAIAAQHAIEKHFCFVERGCIPEPGIKFSESKARRSIMRTGCAPDKTEASKKQAKCRRRENRK